MSTVTANIFEQAARIKLRFDTERGQLAAENLWDLPLTSTNKLSLDGIAVELNRAIKATAEESFVKNSKKDTVLQLRFDIVKHIIDIKVAENEAKTKEKVRESQIGKIDEMIAAKQDQALGNMSLEELQAMKAGL